MRKESVAISIDSELLNELKKEAKDLKISLSSYMTIILVKRSK